MESALYWDIEHIRIRLVRMAVERGGSNLISFFESSAEEIRKKLFEDSIPLSSYQEWIALILAMPVTPEEYKKSMYRYSFDTDDLVSHNARTTTIHEWIDINCSIQGRNSCVLSDTKCIYLV